MTVLWWVPIHAPPEASYAFLPSLHAIQELWSFFLHLLPACCERQWPIWPIIHQPWMGQFGWFPSHPITIMYAEIVSQKNITKSMSAKLPPVKPWPQRLPKKVDFTKSDLEPPAVSSRKPQNFEQHSPGESHYTADESAIIQRWDEWCPSTCNLPAAFLFRQRNPPVVLCWAGLLQKMWSEK